MQTVYIETSIISYLRAKNSLQVTSVAKQIVTRRWWEEERHNYQMVISQHVLDEVSAGNPTLAAERLACLNDVPVLESPPAVALMAERLLASALLPAKARLDALHICTAAFHRLDYLLTWNCAHIANARTIPRIRNILSELGYDLPVVCTPEEMIDDPNDGILDFD